VEPVGQKLIATASDSLKDQTFYLSRLSVPQIENVLFPLGSLNKNVVKAIATENGLGALAMARESMGVCFIGKRRMPDFLSDYLFDPFSKKIFDIDSGKFLGKREFPIYGVAVGQRTKFQTKERNHRKRPIAVVDKSPNGDVLTCSGTNHPALFTNNFTLMDLSLPVEGLFEISEDDVLSVFVRLYHRSPVIPAAIRKIDGHIFCWMDKPIQNLTRGHPVAIYIRKEQFGLHWEQSDDPSLEMLLIGGGCIHSAGISLWEMQNFKLQPFRKHPFWAEMLHRKDYQVGIPPSNLNLSYALAYRDHVDHLKRHRP